MIDYNNILNKRIEFMRSLLVEIDSDDTQEIIDQKTRSNTIADQMMCNIQLAIDLLKCPYYNNSALD